MPETFASYEWFVKKAEDLLTPLAALLEDGQSTIRIEGPPSDHGELADKLESVSRPMLMAALWLAADRQPADDQGLDAEALAGWFRQAITLGTDPTSDQYWGDLTNFHQHAVEMAILAIALDVARDTLWTPLPEDAKKRAADWLAQIRGHVGHRNNHLFFDVLVLEFLDSIGHARPGDAAAIAHLMDQLESMYIRDGWFIDGTNETYDHYNAYAFHIYGLYWAHRYGDRDRSRADTWVSWAARFVTDYAHLFAASGEPVPIGRSLTYRFNGVGAFPLAALNGIDTLDLGVARNVAARCIDFFTSKDITQSQGCLSIGWTNRFDNIREPYSCAGSPYWASKGFMMLLLPRDHAFFKAELQALPVESGEHRVVRAAGWVVRSIDNTNVEVINMGAVCSPRHAQRFGPARWGRLAYRTGVGNLIATNTLLPPPDLTIRAQADGGDTIETRLGGIPTRLDGHAASMQTAIGSQPTSVHVPMECSVRWNGSWLLVTIRARPVSPTRLTCGGFALGDTKPLATSASYVTSSDGRRSVITPVAGFDSVSTEATSAGDPRQHTHAEHHAAPIAHTPALSEPTNLAYIVGVTDSDDDWSITTATETKIAVQHPSLGSWTVENPYD